MYKWLKKPFIAFIAGAIIGLGVVVVQNSTRKPEPPVAQTAEPKVEVQVAPQHNPTPEGLLDAINTERAKIGVQPLKLDERLNQSVKMKINDIIEHNHFEHENFNGGQGYDFILKLTGSDCQHAGENIQWVKMSTRSAWGVIAWYKKSEPHKEAMLNQRYDLVGFADSGDYNVTHFCDLR